MVARKCLEVKCWAVVIRGPGGGTRGECRQTTAGSQMLMVARLLLAHQAWAHQEDIRGGKACQVPPPTSSSQWCITFGARTSSLMITTVPKRKKFLSAVGSICRVGWVRGIS